MKYILHVLVAGIFFTISLCSLAQSERKADVNSEMRQLHVELKNVGHDLEILRRDQLNYKIEKDLLKEAYSSNIQTINLVITIVLGVLGVLGYLGIRSVKEIRNDYSVELDKLKTLKTQLVDEIESVRSKQKEVEGQVGDLAKTNEEQDRRLKVMELIEKISNLIGSKQWGWALKYVDIALGLDAENTLLLSQKASCHANQGELTAAIENLKKVLELEPENSSDAMNLLEFLALTNQRNEFEEIYSRYKAAVDSEYDGSLTVYLDALLRTMSGDLKTAKDTLQKFVANQGAEAKNHLGSWSFNEARTITSKIPAGEQKAMVDAMISLFEGKTPPSDFLKVLNAENDLKSESVR